MVCRPSARESVTRWKVADWPTGERKARAVGVEEHGRPHVAFTQVDGNFLYAQPLAINLHVIDAGDAHRIEAVFDAEGHALGRIVEATAGIEQLEQHGAGRKEHTGKE